jgi:hypothetical protein
MINPSTSPWPIESQRNRRQPSQHILHRWRHVEGRLRSVAFEASTDGPPEAGCGHQAPNTKGTASTVPSRRARSAANTAKWAWRDSCGPERI